MFNKIVLFFLLLIPILIFADGGFFNNSGKKVLINNQQAIVLYSDNKAQIVLQNEFIVLDDDDELLWIIPVPAKPQVKIIKEDIFSELNRYNQTNGISNEIVSDVQDEEYIPLKVSNFSDIQIFSSKENSGLNELSLYFKRRKINIDENTNKTLNEYMKKDYYFICASVNVLITENDKTQKYITTPIQISFNSNDQYFPLKLFSQSSNKVKLSIYMFSTTGINDDKIFDADFSIKKIQSKPINTSKSPYTYISDKFPKIRGKVYYLNKFTDVINPEKEYDDLNLNSYLLNRNKYKNALLDTTLDTASRVKAIQSFVYDNSLEIIEIYEKLLKDKNDVVVIHTALALSQNNSNFNPSEILIKQFKKLCNPYYYDCYPLYCNKSFIELFNEMNIKEAVPILVEILNKAREDVLVTHVDKGIPVYAMRALEAMNKLGVNKDAKIGLLFIIDHDKYFYYKSIILAVKMLGDIGDEDTITILSQLARDDWGGSSEPEAWPYYGLRDSAREAILKIKLKNIKDIEKKIFYLRELLLESKDIENNYQASIVLLKMGDNYKSEEIFLSFLKIDNHIYGASQMAIDLKLTTAVPVLVNLLKTKKGNVPDPVYKALEVLDTEGISHEQLIKIAETNSNQHPIDLAEEILNINGNEETIKLLKNANIMEDETKDKIIANIKRRIEQK